MADPEADPVLDAMRQKLAMYEAAGLPVAQIKARIAKREKGVPKAAPVVSLSDESSRRSTDVTTLSNPVVTKAAKKTAKKR